MKNKIKEIVEGVYYIPFAGGYIEQAFINEVCNEIVKGDVGMPYDWFSGVEVGIPNELDEMLIERYSLERKLWTKNAINDGLIKEDASIEEITIACLRMRNLKVIETNVDVIIEKNIARHFLLIAGLETLELNTFEVKLAESKEKVNEFKGLIRDLYYLWINDREKYDSVTSSESNWNDFKGLDNYI